jgi:hypothetical protein
MFATANEENVNKLFTLLPVKYATDLNITKQIAL